MLSSFMRLRDLCKRPTITMFSRKPRGASQNTDQSGRVRTLQALCFDEKNSTQKMRGGTMEQALWKRGFFTTTTPPSHCVRAYRTTGTPSHAAKRTAPADTQIPDLGNRWLDRRRFDASGTRAPTAKIDTRPFTNATDDEPACSVSGTRRRGKTKSSVLGGGAQWRGERMVEASIFNSLVAVVSISLGVVYRCSLETRDPVLRLSGFTLT
ncbi:hypothetical protein B0T16DRAFT_219563 [Cercophora newfieldiana]|uniref:Uncharacterized protein n=1 Tax=Cercophora newfieldiana TaxID=92897 RepID=A0AA39XY57_9PEZI|nr:hypothetical protein B0T16DRAFT_219563 [Cercophora newfieldiana]